VRGLLYDVYIFVSDYNAAVGMCAVTCDLCVIFFVRVHVCLIYLISFFRFVRPQTEIFQLTCGLRVHCPAIKTLCVIALGSYLLENFIFVSIVHSCIPDLPDENCAKNG